ncbi:Homeobox-like_domain superfamily [Hexamita inflata]|uniref:Homeobox-like domain superfamily n=1 Tax=Hexamita inflata TaxID=28002 RepID=A0AA86PV08_9EUKA|nr:Homeobox-like domain superfamily [Hexamita inflata]
MNIKSNPVWIPWKQTEIQQFFMYYELYGNDFHSYTQHLNRTYAQIKAFYHNWIRKQSEDIRSQLKGRKPQK